MKQLTVFQLWHVYQLRTGTKSFIPFWTWVVNSGWTATIDAARGVVISVPVNPSTPATAPAWPGSGRREAVGKGVGA